MRPSADTMGTIVTWSGFLDYFISSAFDLPCFSPTAFARARCAVLVENPDSSRLKIWAPLVIPYSS